MVTVPKVESGSPLFSFIYVKILKPFMWKSFFINVFNLNWVFLRFTFQYLIFLSEKVIETVKVQGNWWSNLFFDVWRLVGETETITVPKNERGS